MKLENSRYRWFNKPLWSRWHYLMLWTLLVMQGALIEWWQACAVASLFVFGMWMADIEMEKYINRN